MKKMLTYALALALALSLTACGQPKTEQPTDPAPSTSVPVDTSTQEPAATPEPIKDTAPKPTEDAQPPEDGQALEELSHDELIAIFEQVYEVSKEVNNSDSEETIRNELLMIEVTASCDNKSLPSDYEDQYREWRPSVISQAPEETLTKPSSQPSSKPSGGNTGSTSGTGGATVTEDPYSDSLTSGEDVNKGMITDPSELDTGTSNPYSGYGEVSIGYGGK